jgi:hypothetical protein
MYEHPTQGDLGRLLSAIMHSAHHKARAEHVRLTSEFTARGMGLSTSLIGSVIGALDKIHVESITEAKRILLDFVERMQSPPGQITATARPHLENLGNTLLAQLPAAGFPAEQQRVRAQYALVFQQRLDGALRDVEIGFVQGAGFARAEKVESKVVWISAAEAVELLKPIMKPYTAQMTICTRAHSGLIRAHAERYMIDSKVADNREVPKDFWWAEGQAALEQNWSIGDFETWIDHRIHLRAFGVSFLRADIEKMIPVANTETPAATVITATPSPGKGGRPKADWWEDLWIEICRQLYVGDLKPKTQADIERAMLQWISDQDKSAGGTTVRDRASKLWRAIKDEN